MRTIVNGLRVEYTERIKLDYVDAGTPDGHKQMASYELNGHPSAAVLDPAGKVLWARMGFMDEDALRKLFAEYALPAA